MDGGFFLIMAAMPFRVLDLGGGGLALGITAAVGALAYIVCAPLAGHFSDRGGRDGLALGGAVALVACAGAAWLAQHLAVIVALQVLMGLGKALYWPPVQATVGDLAPAHCRGAVLGRYNLAWSGGKSAGFVLAGLLLTRFGFGATYLAGAAAVVLATLLLPRRRPSPPRTAEADGPAEPPLPAGFLAMSWVANTAAYGTFGILTFHLPQWCAHLGWPADLYGWYLGTALACQTLVFLALGLRPVAWSRTRLWATRSWRAWRRCSPCPGARTWACSCSPRRWWGWVAAFATRPASPPACGIPACGADGRVSTRASSASAASCPPGWPAPW